MTAPTREELLAKVETLQRENAELRAALEKAAAGLGHAEAADIYPAHVSLPIVSWRAIRDAYIAARAALKTGAAR